MVRVTRSLPAESRLLFRRLGAPPDRTPPARQARSVALVSDDSDLLEGLQAELRDGALEMVDESALDGELHAKVVVLDARRIERFAAVERLTGNGTAVVVLGAAQAGEQAMRYLDCGADDYVSAHVSPQECAARIRAAGRRYSRATAFAVERTEFRSLEVAEWLAEHQARHGKKTVKLTPCEFKLLEILIQYQDEVVSHHKLIARVWGPEHVSARQYLRVYIRHLREKLEEDPKLPTIILTERGSGYRIRSDAREDAGELVSHAS